MLNQLCQLANYACFYMRRDYAFRCAGYLATVTSALFATDTHVLYAHSAYSKRTHALGKVISKIAPGTNMPRINARRSEDKANQNLLTGEALLSVF